MIKHALVRSWYGFQKCSSGDAHGCIEMVAGVVISVCEYAQEKWLLDSGHPTLATVSYVYDTSSTPSVFGHRYSINPKRTGAQLGTSVAVVREDIECTSSELCRTSLKYT